MLSQLIYKLVCINTLKNRKNQSALRIQNLSLDQKKNLAEGVNLKKHKEYGV
jgi:hypothetical protein